MVWFAVSAPVIAAVTAAAAPVLTVAIVAKGLKDAGVYRTEDPNVAIDEAQEEMYKQLANQEAGRLDRINKYMANYAKQQDIQYAKDIQKVGQVASARGLMGGSLESQIAQDLLKEKERNYANIEANLLLGAGTQAEAATQSALTRAETQRQYNQTQQDIQDVQSVKNMMDMFNAYKSGTPTTRQESVEQIPERLKTLKLKSTFDPNTLRF